jgi:hypothetical protein
MSRINGAVLAAVALCGAMGCSDLSQANDAGREALDSCWPDTAPRPDTVSSPDTVIRPDTAPPLDTVSSPDTVIRPDIALRPDIVNKLDTATLFDRMTLDQALGSDTGGSRPTTWAVSAGGASAWNNWASIGVDTSGNSYITGYFLGKIGFGNKVLTTRGRADVFVAKLGPYGKFRWAFSGGGFRMDYACDLALDGSGNVYVCGLFSKWANFGSKTIYAGYLYNLFVIKLDTNGNVLWAISAPRRFVAGAASIAVDGSGNSYITGMFRSSASLGTTELTDARGRGDILVAKLDSMGRFIWATSAGGVAKDYGYDIAVDGSGNSYILGYCEYPGCTIGSTTLTARASGDPFVAKLNSRGRFRWARGVGGPGGISCNSFAVDVAGTSYLTGSFSGTAIFDSTTLTSRGGSDFYVAKLDTNGRFRWAVSAGGTGTDEGNGIAVDSSGDSFITGDTNSSKMLFGSLTLTPVGKYFNMFVARLDSGGKFRWTASAGGSVSVFGYDIAADRRKNLYILGNFNSTAYIGTTTLSPRKGSNDLFVAKVDKSGKF